MAYDAHLNFAYSTVLTAPSPATSGTSLVVQSGDGAKFPTPPFNATIWPQGTQPITTNSEIVRVTGISTDTLTITRIQESTSARSVIVGDQIAATITAKSITDIETQVPNGASQSWTPTFTNMVVSSSTVTGHYTQIGKLIFYNLVVILASTNAPTGAVSFTLPVTSRSYGGTSTLPVIGTSQYYVTNGYPGYAVWVDTTHANLVVENASGTYTLENNLSATVPGTWGATNEIHVTGWYEAA